MSEITNGHEINMDPLQKQMLDDVFDAFTMLARGGLISLMHVDGGFTRYTASAVELFGLPGEYIPNGAMDWTNWIHPEDRKRYLDVMGGLVNGSAMTYDLTYRVRTVKGEYVNFRLMGAVLRGADGKPSLIGGAMFNEGVTENVDPLTVLPNKNAYQADLRARIREGKPTLSLQVGVQKFSELNRLYGYTYGNRILQEIAWLIQETVRARGSVYRTEGSAFTILFDAASRDEVGAIYDHIRYSLQRGIEINGIRSVLSTSGGMISTFNEESSADSIYACLHFAYEESKHHRHGDLVDFNGSVNYDEGATLEMVNVIRDRIVDGCQGFGAVSSGDFISALEHDFVFEELGDFILKQSLTDGVRFLERDPGFLLCINVYRVQLEADYFIDNLLYYLRETGFPAHLLSLKFSGECRTIEVERMRSIIEKLHQNKILVVIDGFGRGTDSIAFLKGTPVDAVCMDTQFVRGIEVEGRDREILRYLAQMASTCVEHINIKGVANGTLRDILKQLPVTTMQGGYFSGPLTFDQAVEKYYTKSSSTC